MDDTMQLSSKYVGTACTPLDTEVTLRQCMNYAASIGDDNPWHLDDTRPEGILAPPMLAIALTWRISERFAEYWDSSDFPTEVLMRQVHYSESLHWMKPMKPGDRLRIEGKVASILPHRAGTHLIIEYTARDLLGETVFIERIGGILRGVKCTDAGRGEDEVPARPLPRDYQPAWTADISLSPFAAHIYDGLADVHFPIHISPGFAKMVGLPGIIFQGTGTLAMAVREIAAREADSDPRRLRDARCRFTGMVMPGTDIRIELVEREPTASGTACHFVVRNAQGKLALSDGCVTIASS